MGGSGEVESGLSHWLARRAIGLAHNFYKTLRYGAPYKEPGADYYEERFRRRTLANLRRRADALGFKLVHSELAVVGVS